MRRTLVPRILLFLDIPMVPTGTVSFLMYDATSEMVFGPPFRPTGSIGCRMPCLSVFTSYTIWTELFFPFISLLGTVCVLIPLVRPLGCSPITIPLFPPTSMPGFISFPSSLVSSPFSRSVRAVTLTNSLPKLHHHPLAYAPRPPLVYTICGPTFR